MNKQSLWSKNFIYINLCVIFASFTNFAYIYVLPVHMLRIGGSNTDVGLMGAALTIVGLLTRLALAPQIDRWGRKPMLLLGGGSLSSKCNTNERKYQQGRTSQDTCEVWS